MLGQYGRQQGAVEKARHTWAYTLDSPLLTWLITLGKLIIHLL